MVVKSGEVWSDLDARFVKDGQGQLKKVTNIQAVSTSIDNIIRTAKLERVMFPQFGSSLRGVVFENMNSDALQFLSSNLQQTIEAWDDRVKVSEIEFSLDPDNNRVSLNIQFQIRGYEKVFQHTVPLNSTGEI